MLEGLDPLHTANLTFLPFSVDEGTHGNFGPDRFRDRSSRLATQPYCITSGRLEIDNESRPIPAVLCDPIDDFSDLEGGTNASFYMQMLQHLCGTIYFGPCTTLAVSRDELFDLGGADHIYQMVRDLDLRTGIFRMLFHRSNSQLSVNGCSTKGIELIGIWNLRNVDGQWGINARIPKGKLDEVLRKNPPRPWRSTRLAIARSPPDLFG